jgi:beta-glucosidase/6-phospho-beta-glucosidase/beta-galactosidase
VNEPLPLQSFWIGGFESACHINRARCRLDMAEATRHTENADLDYRLMSGEGIGVAREAVPWYRVDRNGWYDFSSIVPLLEAAGRHEVQIIWTLCHWGWPDEIDPLSADFVGRMARYARASAEFIGRHSDGPHWFTPVNEISFAAWAAGGVGYMHPYLSGASDAVKRQLVSAAIAAMDEIWAVLPAARMLHTDPIIQVVTPRHRPDLAREAYDYSSAQYAAWDMLAGGLAPELGGHPRYLDVVAPNFYASNQWELGAGPLHWDAGPRDDRWVPLHEQLIRLHRRYARPIVIGETSHVGEGRAAWLREVTTEVVRALEIGVALEGVCLYPLVDRPDWENSDHWHRSGVWDLVPGSRGELLRIPCEPYLDELRRSRELVARSLAHHHSLEPAGTGGA